MGLCVLVWKYIWKCDSSACSATPGGVCAGAGGVLSNGEVADLPEAGRGL